MEQSSRELFRCFQNIRWPGSIDTPEESFNKDTLLKLLGSVKQLPIIQPVAEKDFRKEGALAFFGYGACGPSLNDIDQKHRPDKIFNMGGLTLLIENKLIRNGKNEECNIRNGFVQTLDYLSGYRAAGAIFLIFDAGRGKDREWDNYPEYTLIKCLTSCYPLCIVRVREGYFTRVYYD